MRCSQLSYKNESVNCGETPNDKFIGRKTKRKSYKENGILKSKSKFEQEITIRTFKN